MKHILVTGTSRPWDETALRAARMVGRTLAERGFGLVTGNATGVDMAAADAFCTQVARQGCDLGGRYTQLALPYWRRGSFWPIPGYDARESRVALRGTQQWLEEAAARCAAVIMLGGHAGRKRNALAGGGALRIVNRFIEEGKPAFPIPFSGGDSDEVFQAVLKQWSESRVPGLSRDQFLRLALPWTVGTGELVESPARSPGGKAGRLHLVSSRRHGVGVWPSTPRVKRALRSRACLHGSGRHRACGAVGGEDPARS